MRAHTIRKVKILSKNSILTKLQHFHEFFTQILFDNFLVKSKLSTAKKSKTTTFSRVFHPRKIDNFLGKSKLNFWTTNEDFEQCVPLTICITAALDILHTVSLVDRLPVDSSSDLCQVKKTVMQKMMKAKKVVFTIKTLITLRQQPRNQSKKKSKLITATSQNTIST